MGKRKLGYFLAGLILVTLNYFEPVQISAASPQGVLKEAIHWNISADWLDPSIGGVTQSTNLPLYLIHDALVKPMSEGLLTPCLAESYDISPDAKTYEFKLRKGVKFHNGDIMTAEDVVFSFKRYKGPAATFIHDNTKNVEILDPYTVRIHFKEPFPDFLEYLLPGVSTFGWIVPKKYVEKVGDAEFKKHPVGAGPYKFVEFVGGVKLIGEAFEGFWRKVPPIKRMEFHSVMEPATRLAMLRRGEVDIATVMQGVYYESVKKDPNLKMYPQDNATQWIVYIASQWDPKSPWSDPRVRKAASLAIDRQTLADIHLPGAGPLGSLGVKGDPLAVPLPPDKYDPQKAKNLLAEAGYPNGFQGGKFYPYDGGYWALGEQIVNYWKTVGIHVDTVLLDRPAWLAMRNGGKMKGGIFTDISAAPTIGGKLSYLFGGSSYGNYPDIKKLWDASRQEGNPKIRKDLFARVQKLISERTMWIVLTSSSALSAYGPRVKGDPFEGAKSNLWITAPLEDIELK